MSANLYELLSKPFQDFHSVAIECHERGIWTYGELEEQTARYADWLIGLGVKHGDRVVVRQKNRESFSFSKPEKRSHFPALNGLSACTELEFFYRTQNPDLRL